MSIVHVQRLNLGSVLLAPWNGEKKWMLCRCRVRVDAQLAGDSGGTSWRRVQRRKGRNFMQGDKISAEVGVWGIGEIAVPHVPWDRCKAGLRGEPTPPSPKATQKSQNPLMAPQL